MLRHYDEIGLLRPAETDPFTGYRYYSEAQLDTAGRIAGLRAMGFSLAETGAILAEPERISEYLASRRETLLSEARQTHMRLRLLDAAEKRLREGGSIMNYSVTVKTIPEHSAASLRMRLPAYDCEGMAWDILCRETDKLDLVPDDPCLCCAVFHDGEYKESDVDVEIRKSVKGDYPDTEHVRFMRVPAVKVASTIHNGSYMTLDEAMRAVAMWAGDNGYTFNGPAFCIYHVSPHETRDENLLVTEVCYPVE